MGGWHAQVHSYLWKVIGHHLSLKSNLVTFQLNAPVTIRDILIYVQLQVEDMQGYTIYAQNNYKWRTKRGICPWCLDVW